MAIDKSEQQKPQTKIVVIIMMIIIIGLIITFSDSAF